MVVEEEEETAEMSLPNAPPRPRSMTTAPIGAPVARAAA